MRRRRTKPLGLILVSASILLALPGCSVNQMAANALANSLSAGGTSVYMTDDDPILVAEALPFSLKLMESLLESTPEHEGLLVSTASGFVQYSHAFVVRPAIVDEVTDYERAREGRARAKKLFLRAQGYAERALEVRHPGAVEGLWTDLEGTLATLEADDIPAAYWLAASLGSAISVDKSDMELVADLPIVHGLLDRSLELDETWNNGTLHELAIALGGGDGGPDDEVERHFQRAVELNGGRSIGPQVAMAESVCVQQQDLVRFRQLLGEAVAFDVDAHPELRLSNTLAQQHAEWLLSREEELFITTTAAIR
jgi:hypothetical protein